MNLRTIILYYTMYVELLFGLLCLDYLWIRAKMWTNNVCHFHTNDLLHSIAFSSHCCANISVMRTGFVSPWCWLEDFMLYISSALSNYHNEACTMNIKRSIQKKLLLYQIISFQDDRINYSSYTILLLACSPWEKGINCC